MGVEIAIHTEAQEVAEHASSIILSNGTAVSFGDLILAPGRADYDWLQKQMDILGIPYSDNIIDIGIRVETREENYPVVVPREKPTSLPL